MLQRPTIENYHNALNYLSPSEYIRKDDDLSSEVHKEELDDMAVKNKNFRVWLLIMCWI